jgi:hypothetical protein
MTLTLEMEEMGIEWLEGGKKEKTLCSLNDVVEWEDGRYSLRVFLQGYGQKGMLCTAIVH